MISNISSPTYTFNDIPMKISSFFGGNWQAESKLYMEILKPKNRNYNLGNKVGN